MLVNIGPLAPLVRPVCLRQLKYVSPFSAQPEADSLICLAIPLRNGFLKRQVERCGKGEARRGSVSPPPSKKAGVVWPVLDDGKTVGGAPRLRASARPTAGQAAAGSSATAPARRPYGRGASGRPRSAPRGSSVG